MPSAPPSWVILGRVPRVTAAANDLLPGTDLSLALLAPPRVALLTIAPHIFPGDATSDNFPFVLAVDPSGLLLLHANQGKFPDTFDHNYHNPYWTKPSWPKFKEGYFVLDAKSASAFPLPTPNYIRARDQLGLIASPDNASQYMVAELFPRDYGHEADLLCFCSQTGEWENKTMQYPLPPGWTANRVFAHSGMLWWVDLSWCLLACNPFVDHPVLRVVQLPPGKSLQNMENCGEHDKYRCVGVSGRKICFVDMYKNHNIHGSPQISVWTLLHLDSTEWTLKYEATFTEIWDDPSYKKTGLPRKIPELAVIHPRNPDIVYFFLDNLLVGIDVCARKFVECEVCNLVEPYSRHDARYIHVWQLPQALCSGEGEGGTTTEVTDSYNNYSLTWNAEKPCLDLSYGEGRGGNTAKIADFHETNKYIMIRNAQKLIERANEFIQRVNSAYKFGFIVMFKSGENLETLFGTLSGNLREVLHTYSVLAPKKNVLEGPSALCFPRLRMEERHNYVRMTADFAAQFFLNPATRQPNVSAIILAGSADLSNELSQSDMLDQRLAAKILQVIAVSCGGLMGFNMAIEQSATVLSKVKLDQEKKLMQRFIKEINSQSGNYVIGVDDTMAAFELGVLDTLIVWDGLDISRYVLRNSVTGKTEIKYFNKAQEADQRIYNDMEMVVKTLLLDWFVVNYNQLGCTLEVITGETMEGNQLHKAFGGIVGIIRW